MTGRPVGGLAFCLLGKTPGPRATRGHGNHARLRIASTIPGMAAVDHYVLEYLPVLLSFGADVNARGQDKVTALHIAARKGSVLVDALLDAGANIEATDAQGMTPLFYAAMHGKAACLEVLLIRGANPRHVAALGNTALHWIAKNPNPGTLENRLTCSRFLIAAGLDPQTRNALGETPQTLARAESMQSFFEAAVLGAPVRQNERAEEAPDLAL